MFRQSAAFTFLLALVILLAEADLFSDSCPFMDRILDKIERSLLLSGKGAYTDSPGIPPGSGI